MYWHSWITLRFSFYSRHATVQMAKQPSKAMQFVPAPDGSRRVWDRGSLAKMMGVSRENPIRKPIPQIDCSLWIWRETMILETSPGKNWDLSCFQSTAVETCHLAACKRAGRKQWSFWGNSEAHKRGGAGSGAHDRLAQSGHNGGRLEYVVTYEGQKWVLQF